MRVKCIRNLFWIYNFLVFHNQFIDTGRFIFLWEDESQCFPKFLWISPVFIKSVLEEVTALFPELACDLIPKLFV